MADQKKRVLLPPSYNLNGTQSKGNQGSVREIQNPVYVEADGSQQKQRNSIPLPDYETLFPQKRHGVQGQTQWDHIIAEVNQKHRDSTPELMGPEMSVDGPAEPKPNPRSSIPQENPAIKKNQETKPVSSKKVFAPPPPRSTSSPVPRSVVDSSQTHSQNIAPRPQTRASPAAVPASVKTDTSGSGVSRDGEKNVLLPLRSASPASRPPSRLAVDTTPSDDQRKVQVNLNKEAPTAKPRQRASGTEPTKQEESVVKTDKQTLSSSNMGIMDKKEKKDFVQPNQIPSTDTLSKESLGQLNHNQEVDIFTSKVQTEQISEQWGLTSDDFDNIFNQEKTDPFAGWNPSDSFKQSDHRTTTDDEAKQPSPAFQRKNSQRGKKILPAAIHSEKKTFVSQEELGFKEGTTSAAASQDFSTKDATSTSVTLQHQTNEKTESSSFGGDNPTGSDLFHMSSSLFSSGPLPVVLEEPASQTENLSGGKTLLRAWVSPSEVQAVGAQNSSGGGLALNPRRPHPVKPLSSADSSPAVKEIKVWDTTPGKAKVPDSGPYSQLTQEELITLVVKQQTDLSRKDSKIVELEEYIDNLLVRVIEENPSILNSLNAAKPV